MSILTVNYETSTITLADRTFPCVALMCPVHPTKPDDTDGNRCLGGPGGPGIMNHRDFQVIIPLENEVFVMMTIAEGNDDIQDIHLLHRRCIETRIDHGAHDYLPVFMTLSGTTFIPETDRRRLGSIGHVPKGLFSWDHADPEWAVELIDRLSTLPTPVIEVEGPDATPIPLVEWLRLNGEELPGWLDA